MQPLLEKNQSRATGRVFVLCQQFRILQQVNFQTVSAVTIVIQAGNLDKSAPTVVPAITGGIVPHAFAVHQIGDSALSLKW